MPSPCSTSLSADPAAADASLGLLAPAPSDASGVLQENEGAPFETLLAKCDDPAANPGEAPCAPAVAAAPLTAEQLALLAALALQSPAPATPPPPAPALPESTFSRVAGEGTSLVEQLAGGTETLEYRLTPGTAASAALPGTTPSTEPVATPAPGQRSAALAAATTATLPSPQTLTGKGELPLKVAEDNARSMPVATGSVPHGAAPQAPESNPSAEAAAAALAGTPSPVTTRTQASGRTGALARGTLHPENFSAGSLPTGSRGEVSLASTLKNVVQATSEEKVASGQAALGTFAANSGRLMTPETLTTQPALPGDALLGQVLPGSASTLTARVAEAPPAPASHAASLVHEIRDIADGLWAVDRNTVEVRFDFGQQEKLSIRVEYREGQVQATFRTDSPELRDAIAREWQQQSSSSDPRPYRVADPVFSGSGFTAGGDSSRQQRSAEQASFEQTVATTAARSASPSTNPTAVAPASRPEATGLLHAIA
jgi:hypothetical protein